MTDFISAFCVGFAEISVGHPFDTVKVLIQNNKSWRGLTFKDYYRGWKFPMTTAILFNCTVFPVYETIDIQIVDYYLVFYLGLLFLL